MRGGWISIGIRGRGRGRGLTAVGLLWATSDGIMSSFRDRLVVDICAIPWHGLMVDGTFGLWHHDSVELGAIQGVR